MTDKPKRPRRQKKADRMIYPGASATDIRCDYALAPFDRLANEMDHKWGVDRLVELVPPEMAEKYGSAMAKLNEAIDSGNVEQVTLRTGVCIRGLQAMDRQATELGAQPASDELWLVQADGKQFGLLKDDRGWQRALDKNPSVTLLTEREMVMAIEAWQKTQAAQIVLAVKDAFPGAAVQAAKDDNLQDEIPW